MFVKVQLFRRILNFLNFRLSCHGFRMMVCYHDVLKFSEILVYACFYLLMLISYLCSSQTTVLFGRNLAGEISQEFAKRQVSLTRSTTYLTTWIFCDIL